MKVRVHRHMTVGYRSFEKGDVADIPEDRAAPLLAAGHVSVHLEGQATPEVSAPIAGAASSPFAPELSIPPKPSERGPEGYPELAPSPPPAARLIEAETPGPDGPDPADTAARVVPELDSAHTPPAALRVEVEPNPAAIDETAAILGPDGNALPPTGRIKRNGR